MGNRGTPLASTPTAPTSTTPIPTGRTGYILIVDDDDDARELLTRIIHTLHIRTVQAADGVEAVDLINTKPPILILLDIMMPRMDGFAVLNWLLGRPTTRYIPVIIITACDREQAKLLEALRVQSIFRKGEYAPQSLIEAVLNSIKPPRQPSTSIEGTQI